MTKYKMYNTFTFYNNNHYKMNKCNKFQVLRENLETPSFLLLLIIEVLVELAHKTASLNSRQTYFNYSIWGTDGQIHTHTRLDGLHTFLLLLRTTCTVYIKHEKIKLSFQLFMILNT